MDVIFHLWLPIIVSAAAVFIVSSIIHMVLPYHKSDFRKLPREDDVREALEKSHIHRGEYMFPYATESKERNSQEFKEKMNKGPVGILTIFPSGSFNMGYSLATWFIYCIVVSIFSAYIAGHALIPGAIFHSVFRFAGATAFIGYSFALVQDSIWFGRSWANTFKSLFDGLIYALLTAGIFGWLWPSVY
jgi:hypothetical protein